jgi:alpha-tubulin suppressor-like RCC1 family protein
MMKKIFLHAISGLIICLLLGSSLGNVQGSNAMLIQEGDSIAETTYDQPLVSASSISAGSFHTCAVTTEGGLKCWGANYYGQLGDGETTNSSVPVDVVGLTGGVKEVSEGNYHTCVLTSDGAVKCWGDNYSGQLGNGTTGGSLTPGIENVLESGVKAISAGSQHTCAVTSTGGVMCWGNNGSGQLGYDTTTTCNFNPCSKIPMNVVGLDSVVVVGVSAGDNHTCAITSEGGVKCWGNNGDGQLGNGTIVSSSTPVTVKVSPSEDLIAAAVSLGEYHTCAITSEGGVKCWGYNYDGQLGDGTTNDSLYPVDVSGLTSGVKAVSVGGSHNCALTNTGEVKCWGDNDFGQLGDGTTTDHHTPLLVNELSIGIKAVSAGSYHTCELTSGGAVKCWGDNEYGQLGDGTTTQVTTAVNVIGLDSGVGEVSADYQYTCALTETGGVKCWGDQYNGLSGDWPNTSSSTPVDVEGLTSGVKAISTGQYHTCAITTTGGVKCWGYNGYGQLGNGTTEGSLTPDFVDGFTDDGEDAIAISAGVDHTCALTSAGVVKCWGSNAFGQLGVDVVATPSSNTPVDVVGLASGVDAINAGTYHTCALTNNGGIKCWGNNQYGQLGYNVSPSCSIYYLCSDTPDFVDGFTDGDENAIVISAGDQHTCAITEANVVKCWGLNENGQLGDGTYTDRLTPVTVKESTDINLLAVEISAGYQHTCAITTSGGAKCWGYNEDGQLGDGTTTRRRNPVDVLGLTSGVDTISAGTGHTCAITATNGVKCWGDNTHGQLGWRLIWVPVDVIGFVNNFKVYVPIIVRK